MKKQIILLSLIVALLGCNLFKEKIIFEKIIFGTSPCMGECPVYHLQVNSDKTIQLHSVDVYVRNKKYGQNSTDLEFPYNLDTSKIGYFIGIVKDSLYIKLVDELQNIGLSSLKFDNRPVYDVGTTTIIVYYNGKRKFLQANLPPERARNLISILYEICVSSDAIRTDKKLEIEDEKASR